jgi:hypothetical protein
MPTQQLVQDDAVHKRPKANTKKQSRGLRPWDRRLRSRLWTYPTPTSFDSRIAESSSACGVLARGLEVTVQP